MSTSIEECDEGGENDVLIASLIAKRTRLRVDAASTEDNDRRQKLFKEADRLKMILMKAPYCVELFDRSDGVTVWKKIDETEESRNTKRLEWSVVGDVHCAAEGESNSANASAAAVALPLIICTVDSECYRTRLQATLNHLSVPCGANDLKCSFDPMGINLLDLTKHPSVGTKRIVFEGWRQNLLPKLIEMVDKQANPTTNDTHVDRYGFILIAEDDIRLPDEVDAQLLRTVCINSFEQHPQVNILSLGHSWSPTKPNRRQRRRQRRKESSTPLVVNTVHAKDASHSNRKSLCMHLQSGGGVHGATLLAIRSPEGLHSLIDALNSLPMGKRSHFDQFLFHSTLHDLRLALVEPALAGWAEVNETLTSAGNGQRTPNGEGRLQHLPKVGGSSKCFHFELVHRKVVANGYIS